MSHDYLVLDIETSPNRAVEYKQHFPDSKKKPGLHAIISEVVCIGLSFSGERTVILDRQNHDSEKSLLESLRDILNTHRGERFVTFNGKQFDTQILKIRAMKHGIRMPLPEQRSPLHVDLYDILGGKWQSDVSSCSLRELIWMMYGEVASTEGGNQVATWYADGELVKIAEHCEEDVRYTARLYQDIYMRP